MCLNLCVFVSFIYIWTGGRGLQGFIDIFWVITVWKNEGIVIGILMIVARAGAREKRYASRCVGGRELYMGGEKQNRYVRTSETQTIE